MSGYGEYLCFRRVDFLTQCSPLIPKPSPIRWAISAQLIRVFNEIQTFRLFWPPRSFEGQHNFRIPTSEWAMPNETNIVRVSSVVSPYP